MVTLERKLTVCNLSVFQQIKSKWEKGNQFFTSAVQASVQALRSEQIDLRSYEGCLPLTITTITILSVPNE